MPGLPCSMHRPPPSEHVQPTEARLGSSEALTEKPPFSTVFWRAPTRLGSLPKLSICAAPCHVPTPASSFPSAIRSPLLDVVRISGGGLTAVVSYVTHTERETERFPHQVGNAKRRGLQCFDFKGLPGVFAVSAAVPERLAGLRSSAGIPAT